MLLLIMLNENQVCKLDMLMHVYTGKYTCVLCYSTLIQLTTEYILRAQIKLVPTSARRQINAHLECTQLHLQVYKFENHHCNCITNNDVYFYLAKRACAAAAAATAATAAAAAATAAASAAVAAAAAAAAAATAATALPASAAAGAMNIIYV